MWVEIVAKCQGKTDVGWIVTAGNNWLHSFYISAIKNNESRKVSSKENERIEAYLNSDLIHYFTNCFSLIWSLV